MPLIETTIQTLAQQIFTALQTEAQFALDFNSEFAKLRTQLEIMEAYIADAEEHKNKNETLNKTLKRMRELVFEADDLLTDCLIHEEYKGDGFCPSISFDNLKFSYQTGKKLKDINYRIIEIQNSIKSSLSPQLSRIQRNNTIQFARITSQYLDPTDIIGLDDDVEKIKGWMLGKKGVINQVAIVGMGGIGKTTIAQKICNDKEVLGYFDKLIWVPVSQSYSDEKILSSMLYQLQLEGFASSDKGHMLAKITEVLKNKCCLLVMDDVWIERSDWWDKTRSMLSKSTFKSSCVILTARNEGVAISARVDSAQIHRPKILNEEESWTLFCKFAFPATQKNRDEYQFEKVGRDIVKKCGGLPLAIKTIGALMASIHHSPILWKEMNDGFRQLSMKEEYSPVAASLQLSYDELPTRLKQCLLFFSIYPEDTVIHGEQLVHMWVGEGLIQGTGSKTAKDVGFQYLSELASRCLVEVLQRRAYDGRVYSCKMHDLVRDVTISIAKNDEFGSYDEKNKQLLAETSRWLGFTSEMDEKALRKSKKLRTFLLMSIRSVQFDRHMQSLKSLRVLDLSHIKLDNISMEDLLGWITSFKRLACLNLTGVTALKEFPSSIRKLRNLKLLILTGCINLVKLHPSITELKKMLVLDLGSCGLPFLPQGLEAMVHLEELSGFKVVSHTNTLSFQLLDLKKLNNLRVLRMHLSTSSGISSEDGKVLAELKKLKVLVIDAENSSGDGILELMDRLSPPPSLQELYVRRYLHETLPKWIVPGKLPDLRYLCIEDGDIASLGGTPDPEDDRQQSWNIEGLCLKFLPKLEVDWNDLKGSKNKNLKGSMPYLNFVEVSNCFSLTNFPCSVDTTGFWRDLE